MPNDTEDLELQPLLRRLFYRGLWVLAFAIGVSALISVAIRSYLQEQFARHLSQTVRNDLLLGNNAAVLKILKQNIGENFSEIAYLERQMVVFVLDATPDSPRAFLEASTRIPICLQLEQKDCATVLRYHYSLFHYIPLVILVAAGALLIFILVFWILRQHVAAYYREQLKSHKEAALGRLSARICHDLKIPSMIFQRVAYVENAAQFMELRPQLQSHLQRLFAMIEKLKTADLEGLLRMESQTLQQKELLAFLSSIAPHPQQLQLVMRSCLYTYLDLDKFERALANLVLNAFQAGAQLVKVHLQDQQDDLIVLVENDGPEIPNDLVQAFLSQDHTRLHQGLGLRMVKDTVLAHGGSFALESHALWTRFTLRFPNALREPQDAAPLEDTSPQAQPKSCDRSRLIWMAHHLISAACHHIPQAEREPFDFTSGPDALAAAQLVVSRDEDVIGLAIQHAIPIIMAGSLPDDCAWIVALKSRLRLLKLNPSPSMSSAQFNSVQKRGQNPTNVLH